MAQVGRRLKGLMQSRSGFLLFIPILLFMGFVFLHYAHTPDIFDDHHPTKKAHLEQERGLRGDLPVRRAEHHSRDELEESSDDTFVRDEEGENNLDTSETLKEVSPRQTVQSNEPKTEERAKSIHDPLPDDDETRQRRQAVKDAMLHAWKSYERHSWGKDELKPITKSHQDWLHMGCTIVDALDTLWIMDLKDEFNKAKEWVAQSLNFGSVSVSVFETTIREFGGLMSAYYLSGEKIFLEKTRLLADKLIRSFPENGVLPYTTINLGSGGGSYPSWTGNSAILAEFGTVQLEYRALAFELNDPHYAEKADKVIEVLESKADKHGLYPLYWRGGNVQPSGSAISFGAMGDSFYEYLIKQWVQTGRTEPLFRRMYDRAIDGMHEILITENNGLTYVDEVDNGHHKNKMDELACFTGGMLMLGSDGGPRAKLDADVAKKLTRTCYEMWHQMTTGIAPEMVYFKANGIVPGAKHYLLRPETVESIFYMWYFTGDKMYQDWGWEIFQAIERVCRTENGYSGIRDVTVQGGGSKDNLQQTFFLAETLKYLYLLFSPSKPIRLDEWVFNTEAHPLKIYAQNPLK